MEDADKFGIGMIILCLVVIVHIGGLPAMFMFIVMAAILYDMGMRARKRRDEKKHQDTG